MAGFLSDPPSGAEGVGVERRPQPHPPSTSAEETSHNKISLPTSKDHKKILGCLLYLMGGVLHVRREAYHLPASAAMAAFQGLSDLELATVASFLGSESINSLASTCRWTRLCPELNSSTRALARRHGATEVRESDGAALGRLLSVRGSGSCKEAVVKDMWAMEALHLALMDGHGTHLTSLVVDGGIGARIRDGHRPGVVQLSHVLQLLPGLRRLHLLGAVNETGSAVMPWRLLGSGSCPGLEELSVSAIHGGWLARHLDLPALVEALAARTASGIAPLCSLRLTGVPFYKPSDFFRLGLGLPSHVELRLSLTESQMAGLATCFLRPSARPGWLRVLQVGTSWLPARDGSIMVTALAESGLVQGLRELDLLNMGLSAQALGALGVSLSLSCPTPSLEVLRLSDISLPNQAAQVGYAELVAAVLSSCPRLKQLSLLQQRRRSDVGLGEAAATVPTPASTPLLSMVETTLPFVLQWVLRAPPGRLASLQHLEIRPLRHSVRDVVTSLAQALPAMTNLRTLQLKLHVDSLRQANGDECCIGLLADALMVGGARELRSLQLGWTVDGAALVLEGLADGACPKLRELRLERPSACENSEALPAEAHWALACLLKGGPGRDASLAVLEVQEAFVLTELGLESLCLALAESTGARLESLSLSCRPSLLPTDPHSLHMVDSLIAALEQPRAGSRLAKLRLHVLSPANGDRLRKQDLGPLVDHLEGALAAGAWPCMPASRGPVLMCDGGVVAGIRLQQMTAPTHVGHGGTGSGPTRRTGAAAMRRWRRRPLTSRDLAALLLPPVMMLVVVWCRLRALGAGGRRGR